MEEQITETGTDGLAAPSADELRAVEEISEEALADAEKATETGDITDSLGLYLRESGGHALLTAEEEVELAAAAAAGSEAARNRMIEANLRLSAASRSVLLYRHPPGTSSAGVQRKGTLP